jgi:hypothetical protein
MEKNLKIDVTSKVGIGLFEFSADVKYMKEIKDTDYSLSINYYQYIQSELAL